ncbi:hypothetical protein N7539_004290 [Penicillium diatomitis]|uniref:MULE transposase domain-containing protein n=1 Tax=Penicillium diatomitis TaxID=2819901 RepID=A0A9X0BY41_9EURO|nr:uncharacterized protein N7539_004290 [Penicillium diatomitis]KAJ5489400.1 hypothetical protein N7539_004290 [Penicillium diatomitis]
MSMQFVDNLRFDDSDDSDLLEGPEETLQGQGQVSIEETQFALRPAETRHAASEDPPSAYEPPQVYDLPPPPTPKRFKSAEDGVSYINHFAEDNGYGVTTVRSKKDKRGTAKVAVYLQCDRNAPRSVHPVHRRRVIKSLEKDISSNFDQGCYPRQILSSLQQHGHELIQAKDLYNLKDQLIIDILNGRQSIQALLEDLTNQGDWIFRYWLREDDNSLFCLFAMFKTSVVLLKASPYVLWMDCTFKTNRYKMPLLDIVGTLCAGQSFYAGFAFMSNQQEPSFTFALRCLLEVYETETISKGYPSTIFTDKDDANIAAIREVFPETDLMLCLWHIACDIKKYARPPYYTAARFH